MVIVNAMEPAIIRTVIHGAHARYMEAWRLWDGQTVIISINMDIASSAAGSCVSWQMMCMGRTAKMGATGDG